MRKIMVVIGLLVVGSLFACRQVDEINVTPTAVVGPVVVPTTVRPQEPASPTLTPTADPTAEVTVTPASEPVTAEETVCQPPADWPLYTVASGEILFNIAQKTGATVDQLVKANCLEDRSLLTVGQQLAVPHLPQPPFSTKLVVDPIVQNEPGISGYLLEEKRIVTLTWLGEGTWPAAAATGNQLEFVFTPVNGPMQSLAIFENISTNTALEWQVPAKTLGTLSTTFRWPGGEENWAVQSVTVAGVPLESCFFSPYGIGGDIDVRQAPDPASQIIGTTTLGQLYDVSSRAGEDEQLFYEIALAPSRGWVPANRGALVGTSCARLPVSGSAGQPPVVYSFTAAATQIDVGGTVELSWTAAGEEATLCPTTRYVYFTDADCQDVPLNGSLTFALPNDLVPSYQPSFLLTVSTGGVEATAQVAVDLKCAESWFFAPQRPVYGPNCPAKAVNSWAAAQHFEQGTMIWVESPGRYYILAGAPLPQASAVVTYNLFFAADPLNVKQDTSANFTPPAGLYAPESGFGLLWRGDTDPAIANLNHVLGWATGTEFGFTAILQCDDAVPSGGQSWQSCFLQGPNGAIIHIFPLSYGQWNLYTE